MNILMMGAGAVGTAVGGFMARAGHRVTLVGRPAHMEAIRKHGLHISGIWGRHHIEDITCATEVAADGEYDLVLVTVKSFDTAAAIEAVVPVVGPDTLVCSYQNGLSNADAIARVVGWPRTIGARAIWGSRITEPGHVEVTVSANPTAVGAYHEDTPLERVAAIVSAMNSAGIPTVFTEDVRAELWAKVAYNCALNPLCALLDCRYGDLTESEDTRRLMEAIFREIYTVAAAKGVVLFPSTPEEYAEVFYTRLVPPTANHYGSMHEDFRRKRRTEIDALNGAIAHMGNQLEIVCPTNAMITQMVHGYERIHGMIR